MNKIALLAMLVPVFIAGCTAQIPGLTQITPTIVAGAGLTITEYSADQTQVYSNSTDRIMMTVDNLGGASVTDDKSLVMLIGSALSLSDTTGMYWRNPLETVYKHFGKTMTPADPVRDIPASTKSFSWTLTSPSLAAGQSQNYIFIGRTYYDYQTNVGGTVWIYSQAESDAARAAKRSLNKAAFSGTSGPVALIVKTSPDPVVLATGETTFTMTIKISNVGGGTLYRTGGVAYTSGAEDTTLITDELNKVSVSVTAPGFTIPSTCTGEQELVGGKDLTLTCDVTVITPPTTFEGFPITVTATYGYFSERTTSVTVTGR